jgi:hypothetical protein
MLTAAITSGSADLKMPGGSAEGWSCSVTSFDHFSDFCGMANLGY